MQNYAKQRTMMRKRNNNEETKGQLQHLHHPALSLSHPTGHRFVPSALTGDHRKRNTKCVRGEPSKSMIQDKQESKSRLLQLENNIEKSTKPKVGSSKQSTKLTNL